MLGYSVWRYLQPSSKRKVSGHAVLTACVEVFVPAGLAPGAVELGGVESLIGRLRKQAGLRRLIDGGIGWLESRAREGGDSFVQLPRSEQERILTQAANAAPGSLPAEFIGRLRFEVFAHYYAQPQVWASLPYPGPPQPVGFPDHNEPPRNGH